MIYKCNTCNYKTDNKSNFNKHLKSVKHGKKSDKIKGKNSKIPITRSDNKKVLSNEEKVYKCTDCGKKYKYASGLSKHKKGNCDKDGPYKQAIELKHKLDETTKELDYKTKELYDLTKKELQDYKTLLLHVIKNSNNKPNITYNISVRNYVQQYYNNAPPLLPMKNYEVLEFIDKQETLMDKLIFHYNHDTLCMFLGDFLVQYYKKDDPSQQSLWNSDATRLTYVIKRYIAKNKSLWIDDIKGVETIKYVITPMLDYINNYVKDCIKEESDKVIGLTQEEGNNINKNLEILSEITTIINDHLLHDDIIKYIAAYFRMENNTIDV